LADRLPPSRYSVVERGGRLVVIDRDTGQTPPSAAERMAEYDRRMGSERARPADRTVAAEASAEPEAPAAAERPETRPPNPRMAAAVAQINRKQPWQGGPKPAAKAEPARIPPRPQPGAQRAAGGRKTVVTGKWWDAKGPRTIELGPKGQQVLSGGFITLAAALFVAAIIALFIQPVLLFVGVFLLFRFGGNILGPIGAGIVDKAIAERN
jgi:hypothetical protein